MTEENTETGHEVKDLLEGYRYWTNFSIGQLSFSNNLFLTMSIGVLGYLIAQKDIYYSELIINLEYNIDWGIFLYLSSIYLIILSSLLGIITVQSRLKDFRFTRNIKMSQYVLYKHFGRKFKIELSEDENRYPFIAFCKSLGLFFKVIVIIEKKIESEEIRRVKKMEVSDQEGAIEKLQSKFSEIRDFSHVCAKFTWRFHNFQVLSFIIGIALFIITSLR